MKELSCGLIIKVGDKTLACHTTGRRKARGNYDIPKGHKEDFDGDDLDAALRELEEETGMVLSRDDHRIKDHGIFKYNPSKDLHIFSIALGPFECKVDDLVCTSTFVSPYGCELPECDEFRLVVDIDWYFKNLQPIISEILKTY